MWLHLGEWAPHTAASKRLYEQMNLLCRSAVKSLLLRSVLVDNNIRTDIGWFLKPCSLSIDAPQATVLRNKSCQVNALSARCFQAVLTRVCAGDGLNVGFRRSPRPIWL